MYIFYFIFTLDGVSVEMLAYFQFSCCTLYNLHDYIIMIQGKSHLEKMCHLEKEQFCCCNCFLLLCIVLLSLCFTGLYLVVLDAICISKYFIMQCSVCCVCYISNCILHGISMLLY